MDPQFYQQNIQPNPQPQMPLPPKKKNKLLIWAVVSTILMVLFLSLFIWQFSEYSTLKRSFDSEVQASVNQAVASKETELREEFESTTNSDTVLFDGPDVLGDIQFAYPKTWSVYIESNQSGSLQLDATIHPVAITNSTAAFALRVQVIDNEYSDELEDFDRQVEDGELTSKPVSYSGSNGVRLDGQIDDDLTGSIVLLPLRDKTLLLRTESENYTDTYEQMLRTLNFVP